ncbi:hypothetical protein I4U23_016599 [Adineta vaga]|nr:hypothetical protein I4U23_016599 [Adineta vaga]
MDEGSTLLTSTSSVFKRLHWIYLIGYFLAEAGNSLPNSYRYVLYDSYGITRPTIELFYVTFFGSSLFIGTFTTSLADLYGRRWGCLLSGFFYASSYILFNFSLTWILIISNIIGGIANAFYTTAFEAWIIQEHRERLLDDQSLKLILRNAYFGVAIISILTAIIAQFLVKIGGETVPFNVAVVLFIIAMIFIRIFWSENYGIRETNVSTSFISTFRILRADPRIIVLGLCIAFFETAFAIFSIECTPALLITQYRTADRKLLPFGFILAFFMILGMLGTLVFYPLAKYIRIQSYLIIIFLLATIGLIGPVIFPHSFIPILIGFLLFNFCVGIYQPSMSMLRSVYIPDEIRVTAMCFIRVPQLILMLIILLGHFSISTVFIICISLSLLAMIGMILLRNLKMPQERACAVEAQILLDKPSSFSIDLKYPQISATSSSSFIPQHTTNSADDNSLTSTMINEQTASTLNEK